jgi:hypothetical protein
MKLNYNAGEINEPARRRQRSDSPKNKLPNDDMGEALSDDERLRREEPSQQQGHELNLAPLTKRDYLSTKLTPPKQKARPGFRKFSYASLLRYLHHVQLSRPSAWCDCRLSFG